MSGVFVNEGGWRIMLGLVVRSACYRNDSKKRMDVGRSDLLLLDSSDVKTFIEIKIGNNSIAECTTI